jgi:predicted membrane-bound spermidine synthase
MSRRVELVFLVFMASGFGGLIYESLWTHYLRLFLGTSAYAQTLVLVVFIGGLAIGSWLCARFAERLKNPLRWYAAVELAIGLAALVFHPVFVAATDWGYAKLLPAMCSPGSVVCAAQWLLSTLLLLPQSVLIGATFPLVSSAVLRMDSAAPGHHVAMLYFLNSLGAVFGVLASVFVLIPALGLPGTLVFAGLVNIVLAIAALALSRGVPRSLAIAAPAAPQPSEAPATPIVPLLLWTAFLTGLSSFIYEIAWIRMLSLVLGASTYSFELMLASFILGLALGGMWIRGRLDSIDDPVRFLGIVQVVMGLGAAATLPLYGFSFDFMAWLLSAVTRNGPAFVLFNLASSAIALAVMLPATICAGMTLPLITYRLLRSREGERALGLAYSANTLGSIAGVIVAVHVLLGWLGLHGAVITGAAIDAGLGVVLILWAAGRTRWRALWTIPAVAVALAAIAIVFPMDPRRAASGVFRSGVARVASGTRIAFHEDGKTASVDVLASGGLKAILTNGKSDAAIETSAARVPTADELTMAMLALMPLGHAPAAKSAAVIGFGSGMSTHVLLGSPTIERVDTIEIEPAMVRGAAAFRPTVERAFTDPRSHVVIDDAKSFFARAGRRYDIIVSEPSNPWVSGVASLFTEEFYRRLAQSLNEGGVLSQWFHNYEMDAVALASIFNALAKTFPDFTVYTSVDTDIIIVARKGGPVGTFDDQVLGWPGMRRVVQRLDLEDAAELRRRSVGSSTSVLALFRSTGAPANSDYFPILEERTSRARFTEERVQDLAELQQAPVPMLEMLDGGFHPADHPLPARAWGGSDLAARDAWFYRRLVLDPAYVPSTPAPRADSREHAARLVAMWAASCPANLSFDRLLPSLRLIAEVVNVNLAQESALAIWRYMQRSRCAARLDAGERRWLDLFAAVAARDADAMLKNGAAILEAAGDTRDDSTQYAFLATATALVCAGNLAGANRLFALGTRRWLPSGEPSAPLRYLYSMANLPPGTARAATASCRAMPARR